MTSSYTKSEKRRLRLEELEQETDLIPSYPFVSLLTAVKAQVLGFDRPVRQYWLVFDGAPGLEKNDLYCDWNAVPGEDGSEIYAAPEQHELQTWLRNAHGVHIKLDLDETGQWFSILVDVTNGNLLSNWSDPCASYELALEEALYLTLLSLFD